MSANLKGRFETRRDAEMAVERLVQEHGVERRDIVIVPVGDANTAGRQAAGADRKAGEPSTEERQDVALNGAIEVSVDIQDEAMATTIRKAFGEFGSNA